MSAKRKADQKSANVTKKPKGGQQKSAAAVASVSYCCSCYESDIPLRKCPNSECECNGLFICDDCRVTCTKEGCKVDICESCAHYCFSCRGWTCIAHMSKMSNGKICLACAADVEADHAADEAAEAAEAAKAKRDKNKGACDACLNSAGGHTCDHCQRSMCIDCAVVCDGCCDSNSLCPECFEKCSDEYKLGYLCDSCAEQDAVTQLIEETNASAVAGKKSALAALQAAKTASEYVSAAARAVKNAENAAAANYERASATAAAAESTLLKRRGVAPKAK
jgi:hypothetical protein